MRYFTRKVNKEQTKETPLKQPQTQEICGCFRGELFHHVSSFTALGWFSPYTPALTVLMQLQLQGSVIRLP